jgi:plastocyanin
MSNRRIAKAAALSATAAFLATALVLVAAGLGLEAGSEAREVRLVARDMAFYLPGDDTPNPTLRLAAGERVRIVLENADPGMVHDLVAAGLGVATPLVEGGGSAGVELRLPGTPGTHEYLCSLHPVLMRGLVEVR